MRRTIERVLVGLFFVGLAGLGCVLVDDYGISWDEEISRLQNGLPNYIYLTTGDRGPLKASGEKNHGPAFEIVLMFLEKGLGFTDPRPIYLMRHALTFALFASAVFVFYRVLRRRFASRLLGLAGATCLVLSPRIFADAYYNSKDAAFLAAYVFGLATLGRLLRRPTLPGASLHALACGFLIAIRVQGVIVPALTLAVLGGAWLARRLQGEPQPFPFRVAAWYLGLTGLFVTLFWPYLWGNPPRRFVEAYREMSSYPWPGMVLYRGEEIPASRLPWHYAPTWIGLTTPPLYLALAAVGLLTLASRLVRRPLAIWKRRPDDLACLAALAGPVLAVIVLRSTLYDGWRHLYFVYPPLLYFSVLGLAALLNATRKAGPAGRFLRPALAAGCGAAVLGTGWVMVRDHPYQNVYFNALAGSDLHAVKRRYEMDYWGLSCREGLERLLAEDPAAVVTIYPETTPVVDNALLLPPGSRARLRFTHDPDQADYRATHFRGRREDLLARRGDCAVCVGNVQLFVAHRLR